jgi:hypothetical protein
VGGHLTLTGCCVVLCCACCGQAPDADGLERFLGRLPLVMNVVIMSPHGYFGQSNVLGLPDTGGQVRHILSVCSSLTTYI